MPQADVKKLYADGTTENKEKISQIQAEHNKKSRESKSQAALARQITKHRRDLEKSGEDVLYLTRQTNVVLGKWMLFVTLDCVDEVWGLVAEDA